MTELHQTNIDGVRCFWVDSGRPTLSAVLLFRSGMADEPLQESGWLHMLEHLSLHDRGGGALHVNGSVSALITSFETHGPADLVVDHLRGLTQWLDEPEFHELDRERGVLRAEAATRGGPGMRAFGWRYGARGPGVVAMGESGLGRATPEVLRARARRVFTQGNAALVLDGPPPVDLGLTLPPGELLLPEPAVPCEDTLPAGYVDEAGVIVTGVVPRSAAATMLPDVLQRALHTEFRDISGGSYAPWSTYEGVDRESALVIAGSDVSRELLPTLAARTIKLVRRLAKDGPEPARLEELIAARAQAITDPYNRPMLAFRAAHFALDERPPQSQDEVLEELHGISGEDVGRAALAFWKTMLLGVPSETTWDDPLPMLSQPRKEGRVTGRRHRHKNWPAVDTFLVVDDQDVHQVIQDAAYVCYHADDVEGMHVYDDGGRHLITQDGWGITVNPGEWRKGDRVVAALDRMVPVEKHLPQPARPEPHHMARQPLLARLWHGRSTLLRSTGFMVFLVLLCVVWVIGTITISPLLVVVGVTFAFGWGRGWFQEHRKRVYRGR